jgi:hypothetical protein
VFFGQLPAQQIDFIVPVNFLSGKISGGRSQKNQEKHVEDPGHSHPREIKP